MLNNISMFKIAAYMVAALFGLYIITHMLENLNTNKIMCVQNPLSGTLTWHNTAGIKWQGFGKLTTYHKRNIYKFEIPVRFNDGGHGTMIGSVQYDMPMDPINLTQIQNKFGGQDAVEKQLIQTVVNKAIYMTGPLMSSKESYAEKRNYLISYVEDQIQNGVFKTIQTDKKMIDAMSGQEKMVTVVDIQMDKDGVHPLRQEESTLDKFGIKTFNFSIEKLPYDDAVEAQIKQQQAINMDVQTAIASAKKAEQNAITAAKEGEANAAKAKWEQEVIKAQKVTEAQQKLEVAILEAQAAEQNKRAKILEGEGEGTKRRLIMQADGALEKKLDAYIKINEVYAEAIKSYTGAWVPQIIMGSDGGKGSNGANDLIDMLKVKTARDLAIDMSMKKD